MKTDNNELIAEFMGGEDAEDKGNPYQYDKYWDQLMPVVRRICDLYEQWPYEVNKVRTFGIGSDIHKVYNASVEFIKWYNSNLPHR